MKLYACTTPSHEPLLMRHFAPSVSCTDLVFNGLRRLAQHSATGEYESAGFQKTCWDKVDKVDYIIEVLTSEKEPFVYSDVDVRFYGPVRQDLLACLGDAKMAFQWDGRGEECSGFMVLRPTDEVRAFWRAVRARMGTHLMDQDALHEALLLDGLGIATVILPERYWTFGRNGKHWTPGMPVNPPKDLLVHHANWTVGVPNKLALLEDVRKRQQSRGPDDTVISYAVAGVPRPLPDDPTIELSRDIAAAARELRDSGAYALLSPGIDESLSPNLFKGLGHLTPVEAIEASQANEKRTVQHPPMSLAIVLQFWEGDKAEALRLAKLMADIEPEPREDVVLVFAAQEGTQFGDLENRIMLDVGRKFLYSTLTTKVDKRKKYPGIAFEPWHSAAMQLAMAYLDGRTCCHSAFFIEADGCPLRTDWIDRLKRAHEETLMHHKYITGARMREDDHINGSLVAYLPFIFNTPSLALCPASEAWDIFHGRTLVAAAHPTNIIRNEYGITVDNYLFEHYAREAVWLTSVKDGSSKRCARRLLVDKVNRKTAGGTP